MALDLWSQDGANLSPRALAWTVPPKLEARQHRNTAVNNLSNALGRRRHPKRDPAAGLRHPHHLPADAVGRGVFQQPCLPLAAAAASAPRPHAVGETLYS